MLLIALLVVARKFIMRSGGRQYVVCRAIRSSARHDNSHRRTGHGDRCRAVAVDLPQSAASPMSRRFDHRTQSPTCRLRSGTQGYVIPIFEIIGFTFW